MKQVLQNLSNGETSVIDVSERVRKLIKSNNTGEIVASYTIFSLMCIEIWCRQHLDLTPSVANMSLRCQ